MRHAMANRRRNRQGGGGHQGHQGHQGQNRPQPGRATVFDSNGPDVRIRGTAFQIVEKYMTLAKDSAASGDRVLAENYLQHAEHYQRMISQWAEENPAPRTYSDRNPENAGSDAQPDVVVTRPSQAATPAQSDDDLSLPASILGGKTQVSSEDENRGNSRMAVAG
jgi:Domain of unknown function (DUF4167)